MPGGRHFIFFSSSALAASRLVLGARNLLSIECDADLILVKRNDAVIWKGRRDSIVQTEIIPLRGSSLMVMYFNTGESYSFSFSHLTDSQFNQLKLIFKTP